MRGRSTDEWTTSPRSVSPCVSPAWRSAPMSADLPAPRWPNSSTRGVEGSVGSGAGVTMRTLTGLLEVHADVGVVQPRDDVPNDRVGLGVADLPEPEDDLLH